MNTRIALIISVLVGLGACQQPNTHTLSQEILLDKIKGGWAGQVIGCTYGGPTEFRYQQRMIPNDTIIPWDDSRMMWYFENAPGLYDDIYMDLTFVDVFEKEGLDAPVLSHAKAFAEAEYKLWHANQAARYNILNGILPPASGYWENNPHADDIDFQIEADFAGLMSPGMVNAASIICDSIGHIMNYGDGWYGGVYVAAMYSLAFVRDEVTVIVTEGLEAIPKESTFYRCIADVIDWYQEYPDDWTKTWQACEDKWGFDIGCPDGVFSPFNIDAKINAAYIVIGLLYGEGDYGKTIDISTRCGQDSDCNPASAAGILGTMLGYSKIPDYWKQGLDQVEDLDFMYTTMSLNDVYELGFKQAQGMITKQGGQVKKNMVYIPRESIKAVKFEQAFTGHWPNELIRFEPGSKDLHIDHDYTEIEFTGNGFVLRGHADGNGPDPKLSVVIDGEEADVFTMPVSFTTRKHEVYWKYNLPQGKHTLEIQYLNAATGNTVHLNSVLIYDKT